MMMMMNIIFIKIAAAVVGFCYDLNGSKVQKPKIHTFVVF